VNRGASIDDPRAAWLTAAQAARRLGVKRETLYSYASRGLVRTGHALAGDRTRLYNREDVDRLHARSLARAGHSAVAAGALRWGEPVLETSVGAIRDEGPAYRGRSAVALAREGASFEEVAGLLWEGDFRRGPVRGGLGVPQTHVRALLGGAAAEPFEAMLVTAAALSTPTPGDEEPAHRMRAQAPTLVRRLVAACGLATGEGAVAASLEADGAARALLAALGGRTTASHVSAIGEALVLSADHELNASTFAARVAASSGASLGACVVAALAALSGPHHGALTARVAAFVAEVGRPERAADLVGARLARGESIPGFGHPLYPNGDPRGTRLLEVALRVGGRAKGVRAISAIASAMALAAREKPTIDLGLVALAHALALRPGAPLAVFACGRLAGWIAHAIEQRTAGYLLRPRARYVGP
jgi:citrate synthase